MSRSLILCLVHLTIRHDVSAEYLRTVVAESSSAQHSSITHCGAERLLGGSYHTNDTTADPDLGAVMTNSNIVLPTANCPAAAAAPAVAAAAAAAAAAAGNAEHQSRRHRTQLKHVAATPPPFQLRPSIPLLLLMFLLLLFVFKFTYHRTFPRCACPLSAAASLSCWCAMVRAH